MIRTYPKSVGTNSSALTGTLVAFEAFLPLLLLSLRRADWLPDLGLREGEILEGK